MVTPAHRSVAAASTTAAPGIFNPASGITCTSSAEELPSGPLDVARTAARTGPGEPVLPVDGGSARRLRAGSLEEMIYFSDPEYKYEYKSRPGAPARASALSDLWTGRPGEPWQPQ